METFVGDVVTISVETTIDLMDLSLRILFRKPNGTTGFWTATKNSLDASKMYYVTNKEDFDAAGKWKLQAYAFSAGHSGHGKVVELMVNGRLYNEPEIYMSEVLSGTESIGI